MRAKEFIVEKKLSKGKISKSNSESTRGLHLFTDNNFDRLYMLNRIMMATASSDGVNDFEMPPESWVGRNNTAHPYTKEETEKLKQAYKKVGVKYNDLNGGNMDSNELDSTNNKSPVKGFKGYPR